MTKTNQKMIKDQVYFFCYQNRSITFPTRIPLDSYNNFFKLIFTQNAFACTFADLRTRSSPDLIQKTAVQSPSSATSGRDLWNSCFLSQLVVTKQGRKLQKNRVPKVTRHRKFKLFKGFGWNNRYEGNWRSDKHRHLAWVKCASPYRGKCSF